MITLTREEAQQVLYALNQYPIRIWGTEAKRILQARLSAPEPEPVAWRFDQAKYRENDLRGRQWAFDVFSQSKPYMDTMVRNVTPLYTAPPQRKEWQGLTDEEYEAMAEQYVTNCYFDTLKYARAIEAKLRENNT